MPYAAVLWGQLYPPHWLIMPFPSSPSFPPHHSPRNPAGVLMKDGGGSGGGGSVYVPPIPRLRSVIALLANGNVTSASRSYDCDCRDGRGVSVEQPMAPSGSGYFRQQRLPYSRYAFGDWFEDDSDRDIDPPLASDKYEQEVVSREKKDKRDYKQLAVLAERMGLHIRQYASLVRCHCQTTDLIWMIRDLRGRSRFLLVCKEKWMLCL